MKTMKALLILLAGAGFATPVFGASDSHCISAAFENGHVEIRNKCNRDVHYLYCIVNPDASSKAYDCGGGGGTGRLAAGKKAALKVASRKGTKTTFRWFACANPRIAEKWDSMGNRGICRNPGASAAAPGSTRDDRRALQTALKTEGFNPGPADGIFGSGTRAAIKAWQQSIGQAATGQLTEVQIRLLLPRRQWAQAAVVEPATRGNPQPAAGGTWESPAGEPTVTELKVVAKAQENGDGCPGDVTVGTYRYPISGKATNDWGNKVVTEVLYTGEMCNGKPNGKGEISFSRIETPDRGYNGSGVVYQGEVQNGRPHGNGTSFFRYFGDSLMNNNNIEFTGEWREGLRFRGKRTTSVGDDGNIKYKQHDATLDGMGNPRHLWFLRATTCDGGPNVLLDARYCFPYQQLRERGVLSKSWQHDEHKGWYYVGD